MSTKGEKEVKKYLIPKDEFDKAAQIFDENRHGTWTEADIEVIKQCCDEDGLRIVSYDNTRKFLMEYGSGRRRTNGAIQCKLNRMRDNGEL